MDIEINNLTKTFDNKTVFENLTMTLQAGTCNVIMGPSGCGKTTLLRILMGLEQADEGTITGMPSHFSAMFQEDRLCEDFSAVENIAMVMNKFEGISYIIKKGFLPSKSFHKKKDLIEEIQQHLTELGLSDCVNQPVRELSGGMKRRVALIRALLADADVILLDEPFKGLDECMKERAICYFQKQTLGKTTIVVTHDHQEATRLSGHIPFKVIGM